MKFFLGIHHPHRARDLYLVDTPACISVNALRNRRSGFLAPDWLLDSGAFSQIERHGRFAMGVEAYARQILRFSLCGELTAAVAQDFMCEPHVLERTGLSIAEHQRLTIERYQALRLVLDRLEGTVPGADGGVGKAPYLMPVLQGRKPEDYAAHLTSYGALIGPGAWVGVGSLCKRQGDPSAIRGILRAVKRQRPDIRLHGFGVKITALANSDVRGALYSADSMAWSFAARRRGRDPNDLAEAMRFALEVGSLDPTKRTPYWAERVKIEARDNAVF